MRKLTRNTIKPVLRFLPQWQNSMYSLNTTGCAFYHFTLDTCNGHNSFSGGFAHSLADCYNYNDAPYDAYAINISTGDVVDLDTKTIAFNVNMFNLNYDGSPIVRKIKTQEKAAL